MYRVIDNSSGCLWIACPITGINDSIILSPEIENVNARSISLQIIFRKSGCEGMGKAIPNSRQGVFEGTSDWRIRGDKTPKATGRRSAACADGGEELFGDVHAAGLIGVDAVPSDVAGVHVCEKAVPGGL